VAILLERQYTYIHGLEAALASEFPAPTFTREGKAYLKEYPLFSAWTHYLYTAVFPVWFAVLVAYRAIDEMPWGERWSGLDWFDLVVGIAILISIILYLWAFHVHSARVADATD
jgi:hypothetical protein